MRIFALLMGIAVGMTLTAVSAETPAFKFDGSVPGNRGVPSINPDPRVRWQPYPVAGYGLCNNDTCITLPPGAVLVVPFVVRDSTWDTY